MNSTIHIVCLDAPSPPDYGGAIDMYYKIVALAESGKKIILHYFDYNTKRSVEGLEKYCIEIYAYERKNFFRSLPILKPFISNSRINKKLIERLNKDEYPVLLEGIHCAGIIPFLKENKKILLRIHNDEAAYYASLAQSEKNIFKKIYFSTEGKQLKKLQTNMPKQIAMVCLSEKDKSVFEKNYGFQNTHFIPCFIPWQNRPVKKNEQQPSVKFCLYHGNLSINENEAAAIWLIQNIFSQLKIPFIIAGKNSSTRLQNAIKPYPHIALVNNPSIKKLDGFISDAHINVLPSMNNTGVKLKLLHAMMEGKFCITNYNGVAGSGIAKGIVQAEAASAWIAAIMAMMNEDLSESFANERNEMLALYNNEANAVKLNALL